MPSEGGRPSTLYRYRGSYGHALALYSFQDRGRSLVRLHVIDLLGNCVYQDNAWFNLLQPDSFGKMLEKAFQAVAGIRLIGFGLPGEAVGEEITLCDHKTLLGTELLQGCRKKYGCPQCSTMISMPRFMAITEDCSEKGIVPIRYRGYIFLGIFLRGWA